MKKILATAVTVILVGGLFTYAAARPRGGGWGDCNGPGTCWEENGQARRGDGPRWEGKGMRGRGYGPGNCRNSEGFASIEGEIESQEKAMEIVDSFIARTGNPNLKTGSVTESGRDYEVDIVTQDGTLANKLYVEKRSGRIIPA